MSLNLIVTEEGRAALLNAAQTGTDAVTIVEAGLSATAITPDATMTALPGELRRVSTVGGMATASDVIHVSMLDDSTAAYTLRSFALYLDDGRLFAIYGQADPILVKTAESAALIAIDCIFADIAAASVSFGATNFTDPDATTTRKGLIEIATNAEAQGGSDTVRAITPAALAAALLPLLLARDGAGSGLDADLLDGQDGSYYANIAARLGFTPVNKAGDTMTGALGLPGDPTASGHAARKAYVDALTTASAILARLVTVDGSGSGLDADLLDGQDGSYYANIAARLGFTPVNKAGDTIGGALTINGPTVATTPNDGTSGAIRIRANAVTALGIIQFVSSNLAAEFGNLIARADGSLRWNSQLLWHAGNDGAGSGLDADLWRGKTPAQVIADYFQTGSNANGRWWKMPDGAGGTVIEQQGTTGGVSGQGTYTITFPIPFASTNYTVSMNAVIPGANDYDNFPQEIAGSKTVNSVQYYLQDPSSGAFDNIAGVSWRAKGY